MKRLLCSLLLLAAPAFAGDGLYLGGQIGHVSGLGAGGNAIGFGGDLGIPSGSYLDVMIHVQYSSHTGYTLFHPTVDAAFHVLHTADFDLTGELGPGFYFIGGTASATKFGLNFGANGDVILQDSIKIGLGFRWHTLFNSAPSSDFSTVMLRVGYQFD